MAIQIERKDFWDLRDLSALATEHGEVLEDEEATEYELEDAHDTLKELAKLACALGHTVSDTDAEAIAEALDDAMGHYGPTLIHEDYFPDYAEEFVRDCGYISADLPDLIANNIDFKGIADDMKSDYTNVTLDGEEYLIR